MAMLISIFRRPEWRPSKHMLLSVFDRKTCRRFPGRGGVQQADSAPVSSTIHCYFCSTYKLDCYTLDDICVAVQRKRPLREGAERCVPCVRSVACTSNSTALRPEIQNLFEFLTSLLCGTVLLCIFKITRVYW